MNRAASVLFWFALTILVSAALYNTSYRVQDLRQQLRTIKAGIESEQRNIHVLKAEWVFLANPARIEAAAHKYLNLQPTSPRQIADLSALGPHLVLAAIRAPQTDKDAVSAPSAKPLRVAAVATQAPPTAAPEYVNTRMVIGKAAPDMARASAMVAAKASPETFAAQSDDEP